MRKVTAKALSTLTKQERAAMLLEYLSEVVSILRMLGYRQTEIEAAVRHQRTSKLKRPRFPIRHESSVLMLGNALTRWKADGRYCDKFGDPRDLRFSGPPPSLSSLIHEVCPGVDPKHALDVFKQGASVHVGRGGLIRRTKDHVPVFGGAGAIYSKEVLTCLRTLAQANSDVMTRRPGRSASTAVFMLAGSRLPRSRWEDFSWQVRILINSLALLEQWVDANQVNGRESASDIAEESCEPVVVLSMRLPSTETSELK